MITRLITTRLKLKLMPKITKSFRLRRHAWTLSPSIQDIPRSATGVRKPQNQKRNGSGTRIAKFGTNTMMVNGTTGDHPKMASLPMDGVGIRDTGIMMAMYSNTRITNGTDSKARSGSSMVTKFQLSQKDQEVQKTAGNSIS